jgi:surface protein
MNTIYMLLLTLVSHLAIAQTPFITRWNLATAGSGATQLTFGVATSGTVSYTWQEVSPGTASGSGTFTGSTATITSLPSGAVIDLSISPTNFNRFNINNGTDKNRLTDVRQWGTTAWTSMQFAFFGCSNLQISATDVPNLSGVTSMAYTFMECTVLNGPSNIGSWNTATITNMSVMFTDASAFNQPIGSWNTANVVNMSNMFERATAFNQPIGDWNTAKVMYMNQMFSGAIAFNQPISTKPNGIWNTGKVLFMTSMFSNAAAFNQPIGNWDTGKVTSMQAMFLNAAAFNQPLSNWNTGNVTNMGTMFLGATTFNQPIGAWNTTSVTNMGSMFNGASNFNQSLSNWNTANVTGMSQMFTLASSFNKSLGSWTLNASVNLNSMLTASGLDCDQYSATLIGWSANPATPSGRSLGANGRSYGTSAVAARNNLVTNKGWTIASDAASGSDCSGALSFVSRWNLATSGSGATQLSFGVGTTGTVSYTWQEVSPGTASGSGTFTGSTATIAGLPTGSVIDLKINPTNFHGFSINNGTDKSRLLDVRQWGTTSWTSMAQAFYGCANLQISATDYLDLTGVTSMAAMFSSCTVLNGPANIGEWNTAQVTDMNALFDNARAFNQPIGTWKTGEVTDMSNMFFLAQAFNQPVGSWNTAKVTNMERMFSDATAFDQPIGTWDVGEVTSMTYMFYYATAFNKPVGNWDVRKVSNMNYMFLSATSFNQPLGAWTLNPVVTLADMLSGSGQNCYNYSATLIGWNANTSTPSGRSLGAGGIQYGTNAVAARNNLVTTKGWTITGDAASGSDCSSALPVTLVSFSGKKTAKNQNLLKWITADEKDFDRFEIQRSGDAKAFETIGRVLGQGAGGDAVNGQTVNAGMPNTGALSTYTFTDLTPGASNYYRLKMVDRAANGVDGSFQYSRIISMENSAEQAVVGSFYPNPSNGKVFVDVYAMESGSWTLTVTDAAGKILGTQVRDLKMGMNKISVHGLSTGLNLVRFAHGQFSEVRKVVRE